jgi:16S rRNA (cytidine1402-2'-O)-methyltransferase
LTASGLPTDEFHFVGFLPHKSGQRRRQLEGLREVPGTLVLYESPYRVPKLLEELVEILPERPADEEIRGIPAWPSGGIAGRDAATQPERGVRRLGGTSAPIGQLSPASLR